MQGERSEVKRRCFEDERSWFGLLRCSSAVETRFAFRYGAKFHSTLARSGKLKIFRIEDFSLAQRFEFTAYPAHGILKSFFILTFPNFAALLPSKRVPRSATGLERLIEKCFAFRYGVRKAKWCYIRSGQEMPRRERPWRRVRSVRSLRRSRLARSSGVALSTGQAS